MYKPAADVGAADVAAGGQLADDEDEDMDEAPVQLAAPSKIVTTDTTVTVRARIACFDCQGRSDAGSIREILVKVAPQQLILLHGLPQVPICSYLQLHPSTAMLPFLRHWGCCVPVCGQATGEGRCRFGYVACCVVRNSART